MHAEDSHGRQIITKWSDLFIETNYVRACFFAPGNLLFRGAICKLKIKIYFK
jgi:hypothetical protein